jgi:peptidoglycan/LPS O-acetylase OafA/YrhL
MKREEIMNDSMDKTIRETLKEKPRPKLSADFASAVMERVERAEQKRALSRRAAVILAVYWLAVIVISGFIFTGIKWPWWFPVVFLAMTPFVFLAAAAPRGLRRLGDRFLRPII